MMSWFKLINSETYHQNNDNNEYHSFDDKPSLEYLDGSIISWHKNGLLHRIDKPALIRTLISGNKLEEYYKRITEEFIKNKDELTPELGVVFEENDVKVKDYSLRETAKNKAMTENRIVEMYRLLLPKEAEFDMSQVTYPDIDEIFPFKVQLEMVDEIASLIAPTYGETKKK
mgnify:CR=1 FL=1